MKNYFGFRVTPKQSLTHRALSGSIAVVDATVKGRSQVSAKCRSSVGRLSTLFLLLIALSFGFSSQAWAWESFYLVGDFVGSNWSTQDYNLNGKLAGDNGGKYYIDVFAQDGDQYFALIKSDWTRYRPQTQHSTVDDSHYGCYDENTGDHSWKYNAGAGIIRVAIDQTNDGNDRNYYPYVWIEAQWSTANDLPAILKGTKVHIYFGDQWGTGVKKLYSNPNQQNEAFSCPAYRTGSFMVGTTDWKNFRWGVACVTPNQKYYVSNGGFGGLQMPNNVVGGGGYMLYSDNGDKLNSQTNRAQATFNKSSNTITRGTSSSGLSASLGTNSSTSVINRTNSIKYYITSDNFDNYNEFDPTNASGLDAGTYTVAAVVTDGNIYVKAATATLTVTEPTYSVTINNGDHGTVSPNGAQQVGASGMNLTVTPNDCYSHTGWNTTGGASVTDNKVTATATGSVTATYSERFYLRGSLKDNSGNEGMPGWGNDAPFVYANSEFAVTRTLTAGKVYKFMIYDKTAGKQKGCKDDTGNAVIPWNNPWTCDGNYQICFTANVNGNYKFIVTQDGENPRITVIPPSQTIDLYKDNNKIRTISATFGEAFNENVLTLPNDTAKTGYIFGGFYDKNAASGGSQVISKTLAYGKNGKYGTNNSSQTWCYTETTATGYARYSAKTYTVTLPGGGGTNDQNGSIQVTYDSKTANNFTAPTKEGYGIRSTNAFCEDAELTQGVFTQQGGISSKTNTYLTNGAWTYDWTDSKDAPTIYTAWVAQQYTLTLDDNNGTSTKTEKNVTYDANTNLTQKVTIPAKTGQDFTGYWTNTDCTGSQLVGSDGYFLNEVSGYIKATKLWGYANNLTIYAGWANHAYNITYKDQGDNAFSGAWGETAHPTTHTYNTATTLVNAPDKTGYTFDGWYSEATCENKVTELGATVYTADITLYAKWIPTTTAITLDRQDGSATKEIVATYDGNISAVTGLADTDYQRTGYTFKGMRIGTSSGSAQVIIRVDNAWAFQSNAGSGTYTNGANPPVWKYTPNTLTLYTRWDANQYTITLDDNGGTGGSSSIQATYDSNTGIASGVTKPSNDPQIFAGYWTKNGTSDSDWGVQVIGNDGKFIINAGTGAYTDASGNWKYADAITLYAKWDAPAAYAVNFSVIDNASGTLTAVEKGSDPMKEITSGDEIDAGTVITLTFTPNDGTYKFGGSAIKGWKLDGWYSDVEHTQLLKNAAGSNSYDYTVPTNESSVYAYAPKVLNTFAIAVADGQSEMGSVNINQGTAGPAQYQEITANPTTPGYHFVNWTAGTIGNFAFVEGTTQTSASVKVAMKNVQEQTLIANFAETTVGIVPTVNEVGTAQGYTASASVSPIGIATTSVLTATAPQYGYKFVGWTLSENLVVKKSGLLTDLSITVSTNGDGEAVSAQAVYAEDLSTPYVIKGGTAITGSNWGTGFVMTKKPGHSTENIAYYTLSIAAKTPDGEQTSYDFKIEEKGATEDTWYGLDAKGDAWWYGRTSGEQELISTGKNIQLRADMIGDYEVKVDYTGDTPKLTVTFPGETKTKVIVYESGAGTQSREVEVGEVSKPTITAVVPEGLNFKEWICTGGATVAQSNNASTTVQTAGTNGTITATFTTDGMIYFDNAGAQWDGGNARVWVYFFNYNAWYNTKEGEEGPGVSPGAVTGNNKCIEYAEMTRIGKTSIYYYKYSSSKNDIYGVAFAKADQRYYGAFNKTSAAWRTDFHAEAPVYVASHDYQTTNDAGYHSLGYWKPYRSTDSKFYIETYSNNQGSKLGNNFTNDDPTSSVYTMTIDNLETGTYEFKLRGAAGGFYGNNGTINNTITGWEMRQKNASDQVYSNCKLVINTSGTYTFSLDLSAEPMRLSVEYPLATGDYRVEYIDKNVHSLFSDFIKKVSTAKTDTVSFYVGADYQGGMKLQYCSGFEGSTPQWAYVSTEPLLLVADITENGAYLFYVNQVDGTDANVTITKDSPAKKYEGNYYIRTAGTNSMTDYKKVGSTMTNFEYAGQTYDYYLCKWIQDANTDVSFIIANDYNSNLTKVSAADDIAVNNKLPEKANVRFMWDSKTNTLARAYMSGSTNVTDRFLVMEGDEKMYNKEGKHLTTEDGGKIPELNENEINFNDNGDWVYQIDIQANPGARVRLTAKYHETEQYLIGAEGATRRADNTQEILGGNDAGTKYTIRTVYNFKTNQLITAWLPTSPTEVIGDAGQALNADMMLIRRGQNAPQQITFAGAGQLTNIKSIYGAIELVKDTMIDDRMKGDWLADDGYSYRYCNYYISFPFDVKISEIMGLGNYGTNWQMQYYDGAKRAKIGWFAETSTFWTTLSKDSTLHAHTGYLLQLNRNKLRESGKGSIWENIPDGGSIYMYFPSASETIGSIAGGQSKTITIESLPCAIDRTFKQDEGKEYPRNHKFTDSNWNMIGTPLFTTQTGQDAFGQVAEDGQLKYFYKWDYTDNTMKVQDAAEYKFLPMHSYMVQYYGNITWTGSAIGSAITPAAIAARDMETKNYKVDLQLLNNNSRAARTYIEMAAEANQDFRLNEDVYMMTSSADANLYSFAGAYDVAANVLPIENQTVELGVIVNKAGTYTFTTPSAFSGTVSLIDRVANVETDLMLGDYEIYLPKGTIEGRFALKMLINKTDVETSLDNINGMNKLNDGKAHKFIRNNRMFILRDGKVFDAIGSKLR